MQSVKFFKEGGLTLVKAEKRLSLPKRALKLLGSCLTDKANSLQQENAKRH
jgi:hypothetical protein